MDTQATLSQTPSKQELEQLLKIAKQAVNSRFGAKELRPDVGSYSGYLAEPGACFVTLEVNGRLQGCLGTTVAQEPLCQAVYNKALASCYLDRRFRPLEEKQLSFLTVEVSVLSKPTELKVSSEQALVHYLDKNKVGVILSDTHTGALFLPQVWEKLPDTQTFLQHLKLKAGWPADKWSEDIKVQTFEVFHIKDKY